MPKMQEWSLNIEEIKELVKKQTPEMPSVFIWGAPGIGKTSIVLEAAKEMGISCLKFDASMKEPTDIRGILFIVDGKAKYILPDDLPNVERDGKSGILFCDEILFAVPAVQNNLHSLVLERKIGNYKFPADWVIIAASNRQEDRVQIYELSGPLANRFCHINVKPDLEIWERNWGIHHIDPLILSFLRLHPNYFCQEPDALNVFATPRSWEFASKYLNSTLPDRIRRASIAGCIGEGIEAELNAHKTVGQEALDLIEGIKKNQYPNFKTLKASILWVINIYFSSMLTKTPKLTPVVCDYILKVGDHHPELAIHQAILASAAYKKILSEPAWNAVANKYNKFFV